MATLLKASGEACTVKVSSFAQLQELVGGYVILIQCGQGRLSTIAANEDGLPLGLKPNKEASVLVGYLLVGDVVVLSPAEMKVVRG